MSNLSRIGVLIAAVSITLLQRVYEIDIFVCPSCRGRRRLLAAIHDPDSIRRVLDAMGLSSEVPKVAPARGPPGENWWGA